MLVGDDARWLPSASLVGVNLQETALEETDLEPTWNWGVSITSGGGNHISEANLGQASPDRRVILRGLGFGWGRGEN